ncbi:unnamed protein product [Larinioides sclopetarius]|uniref:Uncharacterized protein n=1 Tax=Larinioides sclopetarius TaxID=280406 RepID=A0AAV1Z7S7_9ARAC
MDFPSEPKPINDTKSDEECSDNFVMNVFPASIENDEMPEFSPVKYDSKSENVGNEMDGGKLYLGVVSNSIEHFDSADQEKQNKMNAMNKCKTEDKIDDLQFHLNKNEEKEALEVKNDFMRQINSQEDVSTDGYYALGIETNSSRIGNGVEVPENCATENECEMNYNMFEDSSAKQFPDVESSNFAKDPSNRKGNEDKGDGLQINANKNKEKEVLEVENDFMRQINPQEDVSRGSSYASSIESNSSGIGIDFEAHEDCAAENEGEINDNMFEDSPAKQFLDVESSNFEKDPSNKKENEVLENSGFERNEDIILKEDKDVVSSHNSASLFDSITFPYMNPANCFDIVVPLIGKNVIAVGDIALFNHRYDLAREINRLKAIEDAAYMPKLSYHEWRKQRDARPQEEKDREKRHEKFTAAKTAAYIIKTAIYILNEMQNDNPDEGIIERCFIRFLRAPISPLSLLLSTPFVHVMIYVRGSTDFSSRLRYIADKCYLRCHVMFPIPDGYNFVTVYTSEVVKNIPDQLNGMRNCILDYGDFEYPVSESDDSAFSDDNED